MDFCHVREKIEVENGTVKEILVNKAHIYAKESALFISEKIGDGTEKEQDISLLSSYWFPYEECSSTSNKTPKA